MPPRRRASLDRPDERVEFNGVVDELVVLGDVTVGRGTQGVGWRWSKDWQPVVGGDWCQAHHIGVMLSGRQGIGLADGTVLEYGPNDVYDIPPGHDGWTIGDEPAVFIEWSGIRTWIARHGGTGDRFLATLMFTDVVGSTALASEIGDARWRDRLERHYASIRAALERHHGREIETTGDGMLATFGGPAQAIAAARDIHRSTRDDGLPTRAAIHVGEVEAVGDRVRGLAVHHAARILALAEAGETLLSESARMLLTSESVEVEPRGSHKLKGIPGDHLVHAVVNRD